MRIGLAQINSWLGDFPGNRQKIMSHIQKAHEQKCDLVVFPEASLFGYHPCDLLERPSVVKAQLTELKKIHRALPKGIAVLVGAIVPNPEKEGKPYLNAAVFMEFQRQPQIFSKQLLPTYDVFDESRHIEPGQLKNNILKWKGQRLLVTICEDIWAWPQSQAPRFATYRKNPLKDVQGRIDLVLNLSASPFTSSKLIKRHAVVKATASHFKAPMVYVNMVGGQDELIFDGGSFSVNKKGELTSQCQRFMEDFVVLDLKKESPLSSIQTKKVLSSSQKSLSQDLHLARTQQRQALVLGLRDFAHKNSFPHLHLGLSGGIDSAVVACLAVEAVGPQNVTGLILPGPFSKSDSATLAEELALRLKIQTWKIDIQSQYQSFLTLLESTLGPLPFGIVQENIQARLRSLVLMAYANHHKQSLLLATSNKVELATGYATLYGDMSGGMMPIGDLLKNEVYELAQLYNQKEELIPLEIIRRAPSAELKPQQKDEDSLAPYAKLDPAIEKLVEGLKPAHGTLEKRILHMLMRSEFKRWQAPPILKVSDHAFGRGRRLPLAHRAYY